ncbi:MAG: T9SS type A sorting domain-containing protein, partial [Ferruginibacter sp.]
DNNTLVDVRILNAEGKVLTTKKTQANSTLRIDAAQWRSGIYIVEVIQAGQRRMIKLVKATN